MEGYHKIFIPLIDIHRKAGRMTFKELARNGENEIPNLIIYPAAFNDSLDVPGKTARELSGGEQDVLGLIQEAIEKRHKIPKESVKNYLKNETLEGKVTIYTPTTTPGIHLAYIDDQSLQREGFSIAKLEKIVREGFKSEKPPVILSTNPGYHLKYDSLGIPIEKPKFLFVDADVVNRGTILGNDELYAELQQHGGKIALRRGEEILEQKLHLNQLIKFISGKEYAIVTALMERSENGRIRSIEDERIEIIRPPHGESKTIHVGEMKMDTVLGIKPRDIEQYLALQYGLYNPNVDLLFLCGKQGSGKTILAYAAAIDKILSYDQDIRKRRGLRTDDKAGFFDQIILLKPTDIIGGKRRDVGFLPGTLYQKLRPHLEPYIDAHKMTVLSDIFPFEDLILHPKFENDYGGPRSKFAETKIMNCAHLPCKNEAIQVTFSGFMRGRSVPRTLFLIDEAQNYTPYELKTIISRVGEHSACIVMGDPHQLDNPECTQESNGLTYCIAHFLGKPYTMVSRFSRNYRHQMSEDTDEMHIHSS